MKRLALIVMVSLLWGCAGSGTAVKTGDEKTSVKDRFAEMEARESSMLNMNTSTGPLKITLLSTGKAGSKQNREEEPVQYELSIPIGSSINADCYITEEIAFPSVTLKSIFDNIGALPTIESAGIKKIESDVMNNMAYIYLEAEYLTKDKSYGTAKIIALSLMNVSLYCMHDELGYRKTFLKTVNSLVNSDYIQGFARDLIDYKKRQIDIVYMNDLSIGFSDDFQVNEEENRKKEIVFSSMLFPRDASQVMASDSWDSTVYDGETGKVLSGQNYSYTNNEAEYEIDLEEVSENTYRLSGTFQGKEISQELKSAKGLTASGYVFDLYQRNKTSKKSWIYDEYVPLSPLEATKSTMTLKGKDSSGARLLEYSISSLKVLTYLDKQSYSHAEMEVGNLSFQIKRKYIDVR